MYTDISYSSYSQFLIGISLLLTGVEWAFLSTRTNLAPFFDENAVQLRLQDIGIKMGRLKYIRCQIKLTAKNVASINIFCGFGLITTTLIGTENVEGLFLLLSLFSYLLFNIRNGFGFEGSDQMIIINLLCLVTIKFFPVTTNLMCQFLAIQLILAYFIAGISKILSKHWRNGQAIKMVLSTKSFGTGNINWLLKYRHLPQILCFTVITFEVSWILLPFHINVTILLMVFGVIFHLVNATLMGLNNFFWAFVATYPLVFQGITSWHR